MDVALILTTAVFVENKGTRAHRNSTHHSSDDATWCVARIESSGNNAASVAAKNFKSNPMSSHVFFFISSRLPLIHTTREIGTASGRVNSMGHRQPSMYQVN